jgi:hypothetical protein
MCEEGLFKQESSNILSNVSSNQISWKAMTEEKPKATLAAPAKKPAANNNAKKWNKMI